MPEGWLLVQNEAVKAGLCQRSSSLFTDSSLIWTQVPAFVRRDGMMQDSYISMADWHPPTPCIRKSSVSARSSYIAPLIFASLPLIVESTEALSPELSKISPRYFSVSFSFMVMLPSMTGDS